MDRLTRYNLFLVRIMVTAVVTGVFLFGLWAVLFTLWVAFKYHVLGQKV